MFWISCISFFTFKTTHIFVIGTCIEYFLDIHLKLSSFSEWITDPNDLAYLKLKNRFVSYLVSLGSFKSVIQQVLEENWIPERSSHQRCFIMKRAVFENFVIFIEKHLCWSLILIKFIKTLLKRGSNTGVFLWILRHL